jgi:glycine/D-amino acid oxidase-like deaminating enzyme
MKISEPIWSEALPPIRDPFPGGTLRADVVVVGGGLTGLSIAYHLLARRPGVRVVVLEADHVGAGASGRSTGMVSPGVGQSLAALVRRLGPERACALYDATLHAVRSLEALVAREPIDCELEMTGQLMVARSRGTRRRLRELVALLDPLHLPGVALDDAALAARLRLSPARDGDDHDGPAAVHLPNAGTLHPGRLLAGLAACVRARGGRICEHARVTSIIAGHPVHVALESGEIIADHVVVATAGYTAGLGLLHGRVLPVHLQALVTEPLRPEALAHLRWHGREGVVDARRIFNYFRRTADDRIVFGGGAPRYRWGGRTNDQGGERALDTLARELARTFPPEAELKVARGWTGVIGYIADALPAIERARGWPGVIHVVGWCGHGVALAVASGEWVARLLWDGAAPEDLPWFRDRPPHVPLEPVRWLGFRAAVGMMSALDRWT